MPIPFAASLQLAAALWIGAAAHAAPPTALEHDPFESAVREAVAPQAGRAVVGLKLLHLSGDVGPWLDTGLGLQPGDRVTLLKSGRVLTSRRS